MAMTHAEIVAQVEEDTGRSDKTTVIGNYVNRAQIIIERDAAQLNHDFSCLKREKYADTEDGVKSYTFPSTMKSFYDLRLCESGKQIKLVTLTPMYQDSVRPYPEDNSEGKPVRYIPWGRYFELSPIPDAIYTLYIRCIVYPDTMETGDASDLLYMDEVIIKCAGWLTVLSLNLEKDIRRFKSEYRDLLTGAIRTDQRAHAMDIKLHATPFVGGRTTLDGDRTEYWLKPSFIR